MTNSAVNFNLMAKPTGATCNINCDYCFYLDKKSLYPESDSLKMNDKTLIQYIKQYLQASQNAEEVNFIWQGGEPTLRGLDFYKRVIELQQKYAEGKSVSNTLQTNGIKINQHWCHFLAKHNFLVGISIDGPKNLHDKYRVNNRGQGTFKQVMKAITLLKHHKVAFNTLTTIHQGNMAHGSTIYQFLKDIGSNYQQYIPIVTSTEELCAQQKDYSVSAQGYGDFLIEIFNIWVSKDVGKVYVRDFDNILAQWLGYPSPICNFRKTCGDALIFEHNGDVYCCDHFVEQKYLLGNINQQLLIDIATSTAAKDFGQQKKTRLTSACQSCLYLKLCYGGCPKHRIIKLASEKFPHNYLCPSYKKLFEHITPYMNFMANELKHSRPASNIMAAQN